MNFNVIASLGKEKKRGKYTLTIVFNLGSASVVVENLMLLCTRNSVDEKFK